MSVKKSEHKAIRKEFKKYVIPSIIGMLVQALYVVLDGIVVGQGLGEVALGATNLVFPFTMVIIALGMLISVGGANVYSFYKGKKEDQAANNIFNQCLAIVLGIGVVLSVLGILFKGPLSIFLGANEELLPPSVAYFHWLAVFAIVQISVLVLAIFVRNDGEPRLAMVASIVGAVINAILDVILILVLKWGIEVAAITNGIGMLIEIGFYMTHFIRKKGDLRMRKPTFHAFEISRICRNGIAAFLMEFGVPALILSFNLAIVHFSDTLGVAAYSIVGYICSLISMVIVGIVQGVQPLMSLAHGRGEKEKFRYIHRLGIMAAVILPGILVLLCKLFGKQIVPLFNGNNEELITLTAHILGIYSLAYPIIGVTKMNIVFFQTTERNRAASAISLLRCVGFVQIFILLSVFLLNGRGLYYAYPIGESIHLLISFYFVRKTLQAESLEAEMPQGEMLDTAETERSLLDRKEAPLNSF